MSLPPLVEPADELTVDEVRRYSRHLIIPDVGMTGQKRLKNAKVLVVGAGGLGSPALLYLAAAGVGTLGIIDFDVVDESNLQRQIIHGQSDVGRSKAESARDSIAEINPHVRVVLHETRLDSDNAMEIFAGYDLIVDGTDNFATRYLVNDACVLLGKPYVWGSIYRFDGQASVFWAEYGPCYRCLYPEPPPPGMVPSCAEGGVLGVLCASIGSIQVNEAIKLITGIGEPLAGRLMIYDALEMSYHSVRVNKDPECAVCGKNPTITELIDYEEFCGTVSEEAAAAAEGSTISAKDLAAMLDAGDEIFLIDVREPNEYEIVSIPGATLIPKGEFVSGAALERLPQDKRIVLHCKSGVRSAEALAIVKNAGFSDAVHVGRRRPGLDQPGRSLAPGVLTARTGDEGRPGRDRDRLRRRHPDVRDRGDQGGPPGGDHQPARPGRGGRGDPDRHPGPYRAVHGQPRGRAGRAPRSRARHRVGHSPANMPGWSFSSRWCCPTPGARDTGSRNFRAGRSRLPARRPSCGWERIRRRLRAWSETGAGPRWMPSSRPIQAASSARGPWPGSGRGCRSC